MADWSMLRNAGKEYLSPLSYNTHDAALAKFHMMSSFIDSLSSTNVYDENTFCTPDNIDECITHLNAELSGLGLQPLSRDGVNLTTSTLNNLNDILRMHQKTGRIKEELENRVHRLNGDMTQNYSLIKRLKADKERLEVECAQEKEKHRQTHCKVKTMSAKFKTEKEELKKLQSVIKDRDAQYKHEVKKKQREMNKLMERLNQLLMDKNPDRRIGMDMVGVFNRGDSKRSKWKTTATSNNNRQEEMYQLLLSNYEGKQQELRVENSDLRDCLMDMQRELNSLVDMSGDAVNENLTKNGNLSASSSDTDLSNSSSQYLNDDYFQMPYDILRENLQKSFQGSCKKIRESIKKCSNSSHCSISTSGKSSSPNKSPSKIYDDNKDSHRKSEELEKLSRQIEKYKEIVKQQEELIQKSLHTQSKSMENSFLHESQILQEKESLSEQRRKFYQEKANFEEERQKFTELALQLQQERKQMENERNELFKAQFLQLSPSNSKPPTPPRSYTGEKTRLLPSTPMFSPAPGKGKSPSPAELLKLIQVGKHQLSLSDRSSSGKSSSNKFKSNDSLTGSCMSVHSAPSDLITPKKNKRLSLEELEQIENDIYSHGRRRRSSTGSQSSLDGL